MRLLCKDDVVADKGLGLLVEGGAVVEEAGRSRIRHIADRDAAYPGGFEAAELEITKAVFPGAGLGYKAFAVELAQRDSGAVRQTMEAWQQQVLA